MSIAIELTKQMIMGTLRNPLESAQDRESEFLKMTIAGRRWSRKMRKSMEKERRERQKLMRKSNGQKTGVLCGLPLEKWSIMNLFMEIGRCKMVILAMVPLDIIE